MGVEYDNLELVGQLLGVKSFVNEFVAYSNLNQIQEQLSERSKVSTFGCHEYLLSLA